MRGTPRPSSPGANLPRATSAPGLQRRRLPSAGSRPTTSVRRLSPAPAPALAPPTTRCRPAPTRRARTRRPRSPPAGRDAAPAQACDGGVVRRVGAGHQRARRRRLRRRDGGRGGAHPPSRRPRVVAAGDVRRPRLAAAARRGGDGQDLGRVDDRAAVGAHKVVRRDRRPPPLARPLLPHGIGKAAAPRRDPDQFGDARLPRAPRVAARARALHAWRHASSWARTTR